MTGRGNDPPTLHAPITSLPRTSASSELLAPLARFAGEAGSFGHPDDALHGLVAAFQDALAPDSVHLLEISQDGAIARALICRRGADGVPIPAERYLQALDGRPSGAEWVVAHRDVLHVPRARDHPEIRQDHVERWSAESMLIVPVLLGGEVRAVAALIGATVRAFSDEEITVARALADVAATALGAIEAGGRRREELRHQTAVARAARALHASLELDEVLAALSAEADRALEADMAGVYLGDSSDGGVAVAGHGMSTGWIGKVIRPGEGVGGQVLVSGRSVISNDYQHNVRLPGDIEGLHDVRTAVSVPMRWDGRLRGALSVAFNRMRRITEEDLATLEAIADLAALACQNAETYERARAAASTDSLTGVLNHGAMQERIAEEIERARRSGRPLSVVLADLDNFKSLNDSYGHRVGDRFLKDVAERLGAASRPYDGLARYGGDEFVLLLPDTGETVATEVAERLRAAVASAARAFASGRAEVDASLGVAGWREPLTPAELLERADRALIVAKRTGKDRVVIAGPETDDELALLDVRAGSPSEIVREFWDAIAVSSLPEEALGTLPSFLRRSLALEEVALYEATGGAGPLSLRRTARARHTGDPGPAAFRRPTYLVPPDRPLRMDLGALWRPSLGELLGAFGVAPGDQREPAPRGAYAGIPLIRGGQVRGLLLLRSAASSFPIEHLQQAEVLARQALMVLAGQAGDGSPAAVQALAAAIDARDNYTHEHSEQVVALGSAVARTLGLPSVEVERVERAALLHDVGKVAIPNEILHKPGRLTAEEWETMREHPVIGERILRRTPELADLAPIVRHEHERWDGEGYPDRITGRAIPVGSRIILACDAYNAMITPRPYRRPMSPEAAVAELRTHAGTQFDPDVVAALLRVLAARATPE
jgi:diguanylate cyclase (GGDEF)-like protein/putative nucleotidyltransferase with HDIG domain